MINKLKGVIPDSVLNELADILNTRAISSVQLSAFLAQCHHESAGFTRTVENLNYGAQGLLKTFGSRFRGVENNYARKPEMIANRAYANRGGNGSEASGDGWRYRGRGYIQLTLKSNYVSFDASVPEDITANPDLVATKYPLRSAFWYFDVNKLWGLAGDASRFSDLTGRINTARLHLKERTALFNKFQALLR